MAFDPSAPVLVVEGHDAEIRILRALLQRLRAVNVDDAPDGGAALAKMRARRYGLVIASWDMAPMTGCDFLYEMRGDPGLSRIPVVVTGESKSDNVIAAKKGERQQLHRQAVRCASAQGEDRRGVRHQGGAACGNGRARRKRRRSPHPAKPNPPPPTGRNSTVSLPSA